MFTSRSYITVSCPFDLGWFFSFFVSKVKHGIMERALNLESVQKSFYRPVVKLTWPLWAPCTCIPFNKIRGFGCCELSGPFHVSHARLSWSQSSDVSAAYLGRLLGGVAIIRTCLRSALLCRKHTHTKPVYMRRWSFCPFIFSSILFYHHQKSSEEIENRVGGMSWYSPLKILRRLVVLGSVVLR